MESIFNDPLTVIAPLLILNYIVGSATSSTMFISQFWQTIAAGVGTGVVIGFIAWKLFKRTERELSPILSFAIAMITYVMAVNVGGSGILAVAICAMISIFTLLVAQIALSITLGLFTLLSSTLAGTIYSKVHEEPEEEESKKDEFEGEPEKKALFEELDEKTEN